LKINGVNHLNPEEERISLGEPKKKILLNNQLLTAVKSASVIHQTSND
jgi:hypothetical protein